MKQYANDFFVYGIQPVGDKFQIMYRDKATNAPHLRKFWWPMSQDTNKYDSLGEAVKALKKAIERFNKDHPKEAIRQEEINNA